MVSTTNYHYKKNNSADVAICVPVQNQVTAVFAYSLAMLQKKCGETGLITSLHFNMGSEVAMQRQQLVDQALETKCTHIMWIDLKHKSRKLFLMILRRENKSKIYKCINLRLQIMFMDISSGFIIYLSKSTH